MPALFSILPDPAYRLPLLVSPPRQSNSERVAAESSASHLAPALTTLTFARRPTSSHHRATQNRSPTRPRTLRQVPTFQIRHITFSPSPRLGAGHSAAESRICIALVLMPHAKALKNGSAGLPLTPGSVTSCKRVSPILSCAGSKRLPALFSILLDPAY